MVLSVLLCAGAVPLSVDDQPLPPPPPQQQQQAVISTSQSVVHHQQQQPANVSSSSSNTEYVQYLEHLVGELSGVFATWVHQNPMPSASPDSMSSAHLLDMYRMASCRQQQHPSVSPLPDVIPGHLSSDKWTSCSSPGADLRVRRGLAPMRFRLDSHGSSVESAASSAVSTPSSAASFFSSPSPMPFDLLPSPSPSASSTVSFFADDFPPLSADDLSGRLSPPTADDTDAGAPTTPADASSAADWRQVGRELRGIADHFASTRRRQDSTSSGCQWSLLSAVLRGGPLAATAGPLVSAIAVYLWWKLVRRLTSSA